MCGAVVCVGPLCVYGAAVCVGSLCVGGGAPVRGGHLPPTIGDSRASCGMSADERERVSALVEKAPERMLNDNAVIVLMRPSDEWTEMRWKGKGSEEEEGG